MFRQEAAAETSCDAPDGSRGGNILSNDALYNSVTYHSSQISSFLYHIQTVIQHVGTTTDELYISMERSPLLLQTLMYQA
jgi:hypothetical protein